MQKENFKTMYTNATYFCDKDHLAIMSLAERLKSESHTELEFVKNVFEFVRDDIVFGVDAWKVKASDTLLKGYGACFNKNVLMIAILRNQDIPCRLMVHPMKRTFVKPAAGSAYLTVSNPFYHCFHQVKLNQKWMDFDPTLDQASFNAFFKPLNVNWNIDWNENGMGPLYAESIMGPRVLLDDIDKGLQRNLDSHYLFKWEPDFLLKWYSKLANGIMKNNLEKAQKKQAAVSVCEV